MTISNPTGSNTTRDKSANLDPITKAPGAHPVGTGVGAAAGGMAGVAAAGAAAGTVVGGPIGAAAGLVVGAVVGGLAGKAVAEKIDPTVEDAYWRGAHRTEPYYRSENNYEDYAPAYRVGYLGQSKHEGKSFDSVEDELRSEYDAQRGNSRLPWDKARDASRAAWNRVEGASRDKSRDTH